MHELRNASKIISPLAVFALVFGTGMYSAACIKSASDLGLDSKTFQCSKNSDCVLIDEPCRSCADPIAVNVKFVNAFNEADEEARVDSMCLESCEACDQSQIVVRCQSGQCVANIDPDAIEAEVPKDTDRPRHLAPAPIKLSLPKKAVAPTPAAKVAAPKAAPAKKTKAAKKKTK